MAHWNHRVMKRKIDGEDVYAIHEVYYEMDDEDRILWTENDVAPCGETLEELKQELQRMLKATEKPVLDYDALAIKYAALRQEE